MRTTRHAQSGFIREVFWLAVIIGVVALVLLDALALFNNRQASYSNASAAAREAQSVWVQTQSFPQAKQAAQQYLTGHGEKLVAFKTAQHRGEQLPRLRGHGHGARQDLRLQVPRARSRPEALDAARRAAGEHRVDR